MNLRDEATPPQGSSCGATARFLKGRLKYSKRKIEVDFDFQTEWAALIEVVKGGQRTSTTASARNAQISLTNVMKKRFATDEDFDIALLEGVAEALGIGGLAQMESTQGPNKNSCVCLTRLFGGNHIGIARQVSLAGLHLKDDDGRHSIYNHTVVLFNDGMIVADVTAVNA